MRSFLFIFEHLGSAEMADNVIKSFQRDMIDKPTLRNQGEK